MNKTRKVHVKSFGCQMNVYDSHRMADTLAGAGYSETADAADADLVILNTCNIREKAVDKVYSEIGRIRVMKEEAAVHGRRVLAQVREPLGVAKRVAREPERNTDRHGDRDGDPAPARRR